MITELTKEQEAALEVYKDRGIKIGLAVGPDFDEDKVKDLIDKHRELCGVAKTTTFKIYDSPFAAIEDNEGITPSNALYGQYDINWLEYCRYMDLELGVTGIEKYRYLYALAEQVGWMWMGNYTTIITRRPEEIHLLPKPQADGGTLKVLHNYNGMSLKYRDGNGIYTINGTPIPKEFAHLVEADAEAIDITEVLRISNTEVRTEFLKKVGIEKAFESLNKKKLDEKELDIGGCYELFSVEFGENTRLYLRGECPSNKEPFFEAVPPTCSTVQDALAFRNGTLELPLKLT